MKKKSYGIIAIFAVIVVAFIGLVVFSTTNKKQSKVNYNDYDLNGYIEGNEFNGNIADHVKGDKDKAQVYIVEYADFQCPGCASINTFVNKLPERYDYKLGIIYRNYIMTYHQNGTAAASAALAAGLQGYWKEYGDMLFSNQANWQYASVDERTESFKSLFESVSDGKGDVDKFVADMNSKEVQKKISFDQGAADFVEAPGTPSLYLNGTRIDISSASSETAFYELIDGLVEPLLKESK